MLAATLERLTGADARKFSQIGSGRLRAILDWTVKVAVPNGSRFDYTYRDRVEGPARDDADEIVKGVLEAALTHFAGDFYVKAAGIVGQLELGPHAESARSSRTPIRASRARTDQISRRSCGHVGC